MRVALLFLAFTLWAATPEQEIRAVLDQQAADWNRGDIPAYMKGYAPDTKFVGAAVSRGAAAVQARYEKTYSDRAKMGRLTFSDIEIEMLGPDHASVIGRWKLDRTAEAGGNVGGLFTLVFRRTPAGWRIILDHTS
jgi:uncharacterized protein (TIGR02246 family)